MVSFFFKNECRSERRGSKKLKLACFSTFLELMKVWRPPTKSMNSNLKALFLLQKVRRHLGCEPVFSNVGIICKQVGDRIKRQVIVNFNRSGVSGCTAKPERCDFPRTLDLNDDFMHQRQAVHGSSSSTEMVELELFECLLYCAATDGREAVLCPPAA